MVCSNFNILCVSDCKNLAKFISKITMDCNGCILEGCCGSGGTCFNNWLDALTKEGSEQYKVLQQFISTHIVNDDIRNVGDSVPISWGLPL